MHRPRRDFAHIPARGWALQWPIQSSTGRMDLFVPNDKLMNSFFRNKGGGKFEESRSMKTSRCAKTERTFLAWEWIFAISITTAIRTL